MGQPDTTNKAHSIMGPDCAYCGHRKHWHLAGTRCGWSPCPCVKFDDGIDPVPKNWFAPGWHQLVLRHQVDDLTTYIPQVGRKDRVAFHLRCSCGKEWA